MECEKSGMAELNGTTVETSDAATSAFGLLRRRPACNSSLGSQDEDEDDPTPLQRPRATKQHRDEQLSLPRHISNASPRHSSIFAEKRPRRNTSSPKRLAPPT